MRCGVHSIESYNDFGVCVCTHFANRVFFLRALLRQFGVKHSILNIFNYWCSGRMLYNGWALRCAAMHRDLCVYEKLLAILLLYIANGFIAVVLVYTLVRCNRGANKYRYLYDLCNDYGAHTCDVFAMYYGNGFVHELSKHRE